MDFNLYSNETLSFSHEKLRLQWWPDAKIYLDHLKDHGGEAESQEANKVLHRPTTLVVHRN